VKHKNAQTNIVLVSHTSYFKTRGHFSSRTVVFETKARHFQGQGCDLLCSWTLSCGKILTLQLAYVDGEKWSQWFVFRDCFLVIDIPCWCLMWCVTFPQGFISGQSVSGHTLEGWGKLTLWHHATSPHRLSLWWGCSTFSISFIELTVALWFLFWHC